MWAVLGLLIIMTAHSSASEQIPSQNEIKAALKRGRAIRDQHEVVPDVLQRSAWIMKYNGVLCGQARVSIGELGGENGSVYKLTERYKVAQVSGDEAAVVEYQGSFFLTADLSINSAHLQQKSEFTNLKTAKSHTSNITTDARYKDETLTIERKDSENPPRTLKLKLHNERPMPENALIVLAALVAKQGNGALATAEPLCVAVLSSNADLDVGAIEPAWVSFGPAGKDSPAGAAAQMHVRHLVGEVGKKSMEVDVPGAAVWKNVQSSVLDASFHLLLPPAPPDSGGMLTVEPADAKSPDLDAPIDLGKLGSAQK